MAKNLNVGDPIAFYDADSKSFKEIKIVKKDSFVINSTYYNFETTSGNYFANGVLVHNGAAPSPATTNPDLGDLLVFQVRSLF
ncbi:MAG: hypothetical protein ACP5OZ_05025 [Candidatus Woesearchaeota archaeon]